MSIGIVCTGVDAICGLGKHRLYRLGMDVGVYVECRGDLGEIRAALKYVFEQSDGVSVFYTEKSWPALQKAMLMEFGKSSVFVDGAKPYVIARGFEKVTDGVFCGDVEGKPFIFVDNNLKENVDISALESLSFEKKRRIGIFRRPVNRPSVVYSDEVESILVVEPKAVERVVSEFGESVYTTKGESPQEALFETLKRYNVKIATAESCTAGLIAGTIAHVPGVSAYLEGGCVTYSNQMKMRFLGVNSSTLERYGAVSSEVATQMAIGVLNNTGVDFSVAVTGIAGPTGATKEKPVGLVYIAVAGRGDVVVERVVFGGNRKMVRYKTTRYAILLLRECIIRQ